MAAFKRLWSRPSCTLSWLLILSALTSCIPLQAHGDGNPQLPGTNLQARGKPNALGIPSSDREPPIADITARGEVNPVAEKFITVPDPEMTRYPEWSPLAKENLSSWNDPELIISSTRPMQGMFPANRAMSNGYIGVMVADIGPFFDRDQNMTNRNGEQPREGWPLFNARQTFATVAGFYASLPELPGSNYPELQELGDESVIAGIPHFLGLKLAIGDQTYDSSIDLEIIKSSFLTDLNYKDGLNTWRLTWSPKDHNVSLDIEVTSLVHRHHPNRAATKMQVTARGGDINCTIIDIFDGRSAVRSNLGVKALSENSSIHISVHPDGQPNVTAYLTSIANISNGYTDEPSRRAVASPDNGNNMTIGQEWDVHLMEGKPAIFAKFVGIASTDKFPDAEKTAREESLRAYRDGFDANVRGHMEEWNEVMAPGRITSYRDPVTGRLPENDTVIEKLQIAATADYFNVMQNLQPAGSGLDDAGIAVGGLTSDTYGGMVFWDQDFWIYPPMAHYAPNYARQMLLARINQLPQAKRNAQAAYVQDVYKFPEEAALFPWTAGKFGNATATGPTLNYEYHLNAAIVLSAFQYLYITGDEVFFKEKLWPVALAVGYAIDTLLIKDRTGYSVFNMTDPDEFHNNNKDGAYTLAAFSDALKLISKYQEKRGLSVNETWMHKANHVNIHKAPSGITLEYEDMPNNATVKQADVIMMNHPLNYKVSLQEQRDNLAYYDQKLSPDGPAMTHAISAIDTNRVAKSGCSAFTRQYKAQMSNLRAPWFQMSEQANDDQNSNGGTSPSFPFLTGSGGSLQIPLFGYLGLSWQEGYLTIRPALPAPLKHLQIADFYAKGNRFRAIMNSTHTNMTRLPVKIPGLFDSFRNRSMPLIVERRNTTPDTIYSTEHSISLNQTITVENDMYWQRLTIPNNFLQCQSTISGGQYVTGNPPGAATDGDTGTRWQPLTQNASNITVDTSNVPFQRVTQLNLDFGTRTPKHARVAFTNRTDLASIWEATPIELNVTTTDFLNNEVALHPANTTVFNITEEHWSGKYAILEIEGCQGCGKLVLVKKEPTYWQDDGLGAYVGEFAVVGETGIDLVKNLKEVTADDRQGAKGDVVDAQDAHVLALTKSVN
ncbi:carbohydrate-binding module family 32 protein, partial [Stipitochalara longipes BDJ]